MQLFAARVWGANLLKFQVFAALLWCNTLFAPAANAEINGVTATSEENPSAMLAEIRINGDLIPEFHSYLHSGDGRYWLPIDILVVFSEGTATTSGRLRIFQVYGPDKAVEIDTQKGTIKTSAGFEALGDAYIVRDDELFLDLTVLERHFGFRVEVRQADGFIDVASSMPTPRISRLNRQRTWKKFGTGGEEAQGTFPEIEVPYALFSGIQADFAGWTQWNVSRSRPFNQMSLSASTEALYLTNHLFFSIDSNNQRIARWRAGRTDPAGNLFGLNGLYSFEFGDIVGQAIPMVGSLGLGQGIRVQAAPFRLADGFDTTTVEGDAQPEWDAELYVSGQLRGFMRVGANGRYLFENVAINYGRNDIKVRVYGPNGERRAIDHSQSISAGLLPPGKMNAWFSAVRPGTSVFGTRSSGAPGTFNSGGRVDYGLTRFLTLGVQGGHVSDIPRLGPSGMPFLQSSFYSSGELRFQVGGFSASTVAVHQSATGGVATNVFAQLPLLPRGLTIGFESIGSTFETMYTGYGEQALKRRFRAATGLNFPFLGSGSSLFLSIERAEERNGSREDRLAATYGHDLLGVPLTHDLILSRRSNGDRNFGPLSGNYRLATSYQFDQLQFRGEFLAAVGAGVQPELINVQAQYQARQTDTFSAGASYSFRGDHSFFVGASRDFGGLFNGSLTASHGGGGLQIMARISFSFGAHVGNGMNLGSMDRANYGAARIRSFYDDNYNGKKDDDEAVFKGLKVQVNGSPDELETGDEGHLTVWALDPTSPTAFEIDRERPANEFLTTGQPRFSSFVRQGRMFNLDIPLMNAVSVGGRVLWADQNGVLRPLGQATIIARQKTGNVSVEVSSLTDGSFSIGDLFPGDWVVEVRSSRLDPRSFAQSQKVPLSIPPKADSEEIGDIIFRPTAN